MRQLLLLLILNIFSFSNAIVISENFHANFTQVVTNPKNKIIKYSGKIYFLDSSKLKWKYEQPTKKEVCSSENHVIVVDHDLEQVSKYNLVDRFNLIAILKSAKHHDKNLYLAKYLGKQYTIQVDKDNRLQAVAYFDDLDNKVQILFTKIKYEKAPLKTVTCTYPKDYDLIEG